jgi:hypothetical protein
MNLRPNSVSYYWLVKSALETEHLRRSLTDSILGRDALGQPQSPAQPDELARLSGYRRSFHAILHLACNLAHTDRRLVCRKAALFPGHTS